MREVKPGEVWRMPGVQAEGVILLSERILLVTRSEPRSESCQTLDLLTGAVGWVSWQLLLCDSVMERLA